MPDNVTVCYSTNPEPERLVQNNRTVATFSASMWYGETDSFGIRVIGKSADGINPFRIGITSKAKYDESRRMADLTSSTHEDFLNLGKLAPLPEEETPATTTTKQPQETSSKTAADQQTETVAEYEAGFRQYITKQMAEGQLNYVATWANWTG